MSHAPDSLPEHLRVCVVGLGKIGLPLAVQYASRDMSVIGADIDPDVIDVVRTGKPPFPGEDQLEDRLGSVIERSRLRVTTDTTEAVAASDVIVVVVPLVVDDCGAPDYGAMDAATESIGRGLRPGCLVLYETTLPVTTTRRRFVPALERASGLTAGANLFVAFSPERVYSGRIFADLRRYPKIVGGIDQTSGRLATEFYERALEFDERDDLPRENGVWNLGSAEAAELTKLAETTYRDINIAFANELATFSERAGIDVFAVIAAANSQPFSHIHQPGIAVGGHCIPVYPRLYLENSPGSRIPALAREVNESIPEHAVQRLEQALGRLTGQRIVVLGAAYRGGVKETAFSGVFALVTALGRRQASVLVHDPLFTDQELIALGLEPFHLGDECIGAIIQADHERYRRLEPADLPGLQALFDGRNITEPAVWTTAGVRHIQLGRS